jgi:hypothetical protein
MQATRKFWSSIMSSLGMLDLFLSAFIIFSLLIAALIAGPSAFVSPQAEVEHADTSVSYFNVTLANGTIVTENVTTTQIFYTLEDTCTSHSCGWWLNRLALLIAVISLSLFILAFAFSAIGIAAQESNSLRAGIAKSGTVYAGLEVVSPPITFLGNVLLSVLGLWAILVSVLLVIAVVAGKHEFAFIASCVILSGFALIAGALLFLTVFRNEAPIVVQPVVAAYPVNGSAPSITPGAAYL